MSARAIILTGVFFLIAYFVIAQDYQHFFNEAKKALGEKRYQEFYTLIKKAHELHHYHQTIAIIAREEIQRKYLKKTFQEK